MNDPTNPDGSDAMQHNFRGSSSLNLIGGIVGVDPPSPSDLSLDVKVTNVSRHVSSQS
jgi:hypothetical protein